MVVEGSWWEEERTRKQVETYWSGQLFNRQSCVGPYAEPSCASQLAVPAIMQGTRAKKQVKAAIGTA
jgi:hypothetical protein